jgi:hypothetical protein
VASRAAQEALQEKLSRSGRQADVVKLLQARAKQLAEELGRARAEAEELHEQLAEEKKKVSGRDGGGGGKGARGCLKESKGACQLCRVKAGLNTAQRISCPATLPLPQARGAAQRLDILKDQQRLWQEK